MALRNMVSTATCTTEWQDGADVVEATGFAIPVDPSVDNDNVTTNPYEDMIWQCWKTAPIEACGLLSDDQSYPREPRARNVHPMTNIHKNSVNFFQMNGDELLRVWNDIEAKGGRVVAYYHSHTQPGDEPCPSETDLLAVIPDLLSVIVAFVDGQPVVRTWAGPIPYGGNLFD